MSKTENKITNSYTFFECTYCKFSKKRKFTDGDTVFLTNQKCTECDRKMLVTKIFGEIMD